MLNTNSITLPPVEIMSAAARTLIERTTDANEQAMINKAIYTLQRGVEIDTTAGGFLIPSSDKRNVYRITHMGECSCKGGVKHGHCYHGKMIAIVEEAAQYTMPALPKRSAVTYEKALAEINELF